MITIQYEQSEIRATCTSSGGELLVATEIQLPPGAMLSWYRVAHDGEASALEAQAAAEAVARIQAMRASQAAGQSTTSAI